MTTTNTQEKAISLNTRKEIEYDIHNGLFDEAATTHYKYYQDEHNGLEVEVCVDIDEWIALKDFSVNIMSEFGDEYILEEGQYNILYDTILHRLDNVREEELAEAKHIRQLMFA